MQSESSSSEKRRNLGMKDLNPPNLLVYENGGHFGTEQGDDEERTLFLKAMY